MDMNTDDPDSGLRPELVHQPRILTPEARSRIRHSFPAVMWPDVDVVLLCLDPIYADPACLVSPDSIGPVLLNGEQLSIPCRVYLLQPESDRISALTPGQQLILSAILSRSSDGFVREKCVAQDATSRLLAGAQHQIDGREVRDERLEELRVGWMAVVVKPYRDAVLRAGIPGAPGKGDRSVRRRRTGRRHRPPDR